MAKTVIGTNEELMVVYPTKECMIAKILYYQEEIQELPKSQIKVDLTKSELDMAKMLIETMTQKFDIAAYHDEYQQRLREAITTKINEIVAADTSTPNNIINLMEALQKSVDIAKHKGTA